MQFFIIHPDPETNAKMLPDYAIKKVNVREGWQILSDIGHNLGITWEGQNKPYSIWHAETRRFMVNREAFELFLNHYRFCLNEYTERFGNDTIFHDKYFTTLPVLTLCLKIPSHRTHEQFMLDYLIRSKKEKMSKLDYNKLLQIKENGK
jgi:hypothetical protein